MEEQRIALDRVGPWRISTVWLLGINHQFGDGPPLYYETMVFRGDEMEDLDMERYTTREEAYAGHDRMVAKWREKNG